MYLKKIFTLCIAFCGLCVASCKKAETITWLDYADEAIVMGYYSNNCFSGYVFEILETSGLRPMTYSRELPSNTEKHQFVNFPIKVKMIYKSIDDDCLAHDNVIEIEKLKVVN